jgi:phosphoglycolate phosphatase-like HAD superfamily hydrolase
MMLNQKQPGIYLDNSISDYLVSLDAIIFDCDGVLIDVTKSYDDAINKTTKFVLEKFFQITNSININSKIIDGFKSTGGFNDEVDVTYASIVSIVSAKKLHRNENEFIFEVISHADSSGIISIEEYLKKFIDFRDIKNKLSYPGTHHENLLYQIFDQIFYGPILYNKLFNKKSQFSEPGLIENDIVILNNSLIEKLTKKFGSKISLVTGRGKESINYSLKDLLKKFDLINSAFLEDEPRELAKPNPESLIRSINGLKSQHSMFVGDSMEDFIMAKEATKLGKKTTFCGIIGTSTDPQKKLELFQNNGASIILDSINLLPKVLNLD